MAIRAIWSGAVLALPLLSLIDTLLINYFNSFGGDTCDVYCGPGGLLTIYAMAGVGIVIWFAGMIVLLIELVRTKARGWWAWVALAIEVASPLALTMQWFAWGG
jgi:hypothetical protein